MTRDNDIARDGQGTAPASAGVAHTPGPWRYVWFGGPQIGGGKDGAAAVCTLWGSFRTGQETIEEAANRDLILAAPDLLEALQLVLDTYGYDGCTDSSIWATVSAAILKAKGQSNAG